MTSGRLSVDETACVVWNRAAIWRSRGDGEEDQLRHDECRVPVDGAGHGGDHVVVREYLPELQPGDQRQHEHAHHDVDIG
jgi:hypothetical protein